MARDIRYIDKPVLVRDRYLRTVLSQLTRDCTLVMLPIGTRVVFGSRDIIDNRKIERKVFNITRVILEL